MDIYVDGILSTSWTSSGIISDFETVDLGVAGQTIELRGVLADSEWLSIMEVRTRTGRRWVHCGGTAALYTYLCFYCRRPGTVYETSIRQQTDICNATCGYLTAHKWAWNGAM